MKTALYSLLLTLTLSSINLSAYANSSEDFDADADLIQLIESPEHQTFNDYELIYNRATRPQNAVKQIPVGRFTGYRFTVTPATLRPFSMMVVMDDVTLVRGKLLFLAIFAAGNPNDLTYDIDYFKNAPARVVEDSLQYTLKSLQERDPSGLRVFQTPSILNRELVLTSLDDKGNTTVIFTGRKIGKHLMLKRAYQGKAIGYGLIKNAFQR